MARGQSRQSFAVPCSCVLELSKLAIGVIKLLLLLTTMLLQLSDLASERGELTLVQCLDAIKLSLKTAAMTHGCLNPSLYPCSHLCGTRCQ